MHQVLENLCEKLEEIHKIVSIGAQENRTFYEINNWTYPLITRLELASIPLRISTRLKNLNIEFIDDDLISSINSFLPRFQHIEAIVLYLGNSNSIQAVPVYLSAFNVLSSILEPLFAWDTLQDKRAMPAIQIKRLETIKSRIDKISPNMDELQIKIKMIEEATEAAELLPETLERLKAKRDEIEKHSKDAHSYAFDAESANSSAKQKLNEINQHKESAEKLVSSCEEAYRITTSKGLAGAFEVKAKKLSESMWIWVAGLVFALCVGAYIGAQRLETLSVMLSSTANYNANSLWIQALLSALSLGAPLWFAWLATKQIGQRFRLAEDYAYKASVSKAYEGYRREAVRIDEAFEARLFATALTRLEEAPLRLVEDETHGSPWHELITSPAFKKAIDSIPELKEKFIEVAKRGIESTSQTKKQKAIEKSDVKSED